MGLGLGWFRVSGPGFGAQRSHAGAPNSQKAAVLHHQRQEVVLSDSGLGFRGQGLGLRV